MQVRDYNARRINRNAEYLSLGTWRESFGTHKAAERESSDIVVRGSLCMYAKVLQVVSFLHEV
jgi:hypothetical protein